MANEERLRQRCEEAAYTLGTGDFEVQVMTTELEREEAVNADLQRQIDEAHSASSSSITSAAASGAAWLFGGSEVTMHSSAEKVQKLRQAKMAVDTRVAHLASKIGRVKAEQEKAMALLVEAESEGTNEKPATERIKMKQAILDLARKVDPEGAQCVLTLGRMLLRTPRFLQDKNLLGSAAPLQSLEAEEADELSEALDFAFHDANRMFEIVGRKTDEAVNQEKEAVDYLLDLFKSEELPQMWREHIIQLVVVKGGMALSRDVTNMEATGHKCAVTANWPRSNVGENAGAYATIMSLFEVHSEEHAPLETRGRKSAAGQKSKDPFTRLLDSVDSSYLEAIYKDPMVYATPRVLEALLMSVRIAMCQLKEQEKVLYGHPDCKQTEPHWFVRRKAAGKVCEFAASGNQLACDLICERLLAPTEHWMVRQVVADELCSALGHMVPGSETFNDLLDNLAEVVLTLPHVYHGKCKSLQQQLTERALTNVQSIAEQSLIRELHRYTFDRKMQILRALKRKVELSHTSEIARVFDRISAAIGGMPKEVETSQLHIPTMKWQRERQRELDEKNRKS